MFDSFSDPALSVVSVANSEARSLDHGRIGTEHLLLGLLSEEAGASAELLRSAGATLPAARHMVAEVVGTTAPAGGAAELPYTPRAQRALERAARFSRQERAQLVDTDHVLLGVLDVEGLACQVLRGLGADVGQLRDALTGARTEAGALEVDPVPAVEAAEPRCPSCGKALDAALGSRVMSARREDGKAAPVAVIFCTACGSTFGVTRP